MQASSWIEKTTTVRYVGLEYLGKIVTNVTPFTILLDSGRGIGILLPKLFWPTVRKNCSSDQEKLLKFMAENLQTFWDH